MAFDDLNAPLSITRRVTRMGVNIVSHLIKEIVTLYLSNKLIFKEMLKT